MTTSAFFDDRARKHAALADPVRLRLLDLLVLGDKTPSELRHRLAVTSNLLAHHLKVLEGQKLVARRKSEGDARKTYVRATRDALTMLGYDVSVTAPQVLFVCSANSARSQLAEVLWRQVSAIAVSSAGTHPAQAVASGAIAVAARHGLDLSNAQPRVLSDAAADQALIVTVCDRAHEEYDGGSVHWSIPDPVAGGTDADFEAAFAEIWQRVGDLAAHVSAPAARAQGRSA